MRNPREYRGGDDAERGLQAERTRLAWRRTTLATTAVALVAVTRLVTTGARPIAAVATALIALGWVGVLVVAHRRIRELSAVRPDQTVRPDRPVTHADPPAARRLPAVLAILAASLAVLATLLAGRPV